MLNKILGHMDRVPDVTARADGNLMALFEVYLDECGDDGGFPAFSVGGYLIRTSKARRFEHEWGNLLQSSNVSYFHMVECAHGNGEFAKLSKEERIKLQIGLMDLIKANVEIGFVITIPLFRFVDRDGFGPPYAFSLDKTFDALHWLVSRNQQGRDFALSIYYEAGHKHSGRAVERFRRMRKNYPSIKNITKIRKEQSGLVQAADILVWQYNKYLKDAYSGKREPRKDFQELMKVPTFFPCLYPIEKDRVVMWYWHNGTVFHEDAVKQIRNIFNADFGNDDLATRHKFTISRVTM